VKKATRKGFTKRRRRRSLPGVFSGHRAARARGSAPWRARRETHGIAATLLAGIPRASLVQVLDDDDEVLAEETNETNETNDERVS
jgi:hypothetical protein